MWKGFHRNAMLSVCIMILMLISSLGLQIDAAAQNVTPASVEMPLFDSTDAVSQESAAQASSLMGSVFTENRGQMNNTGMEFYMMTSGGGIGFSRGSVSMMTLERPNVTESSISSRFDDPMSMMSSEPATPEPVKGNVIKLNFVDCNDVEPVGRNPAPWKNNYFYGNDEANWQTNVPNYREIYYENLWDGIDLRYYFTESGQLKYDYIVHPYADYTIIQVQVEGQESISVSKEGALILNENNENPIIDSDLSVFYSGSPSERIDAQFIVSEDCYAIQMNHVDNSRTIIIDPLVYSTFLGGEGGDDAYGGIAVDSNGCAYVFGYTGSENFPLTAGVYDTSINGTRDVFVSKLSTNGDSLIFSTYLGGTSIDDSYGGIVVDSSGCVYIFGETESADFPVTGAAFDTTLNGSRDAFITKINCTGESLIYSTYIGGSVIDEVYGGIAIDSFGCVYVSGHTASSDFPTTIGAFDTILNGSYDAFVTKLSVDGSSLEYSTFIGGSGQEVTMGGIAVDSMGFAYVGGATKSSDFPVSIGAFDTTYNDDGGYDLFICKLSINGDSLIYSTYIGGINDEGIYDRIAIDTNGYVFVCGRTYSANFPVTIDAHDTNFDGTTDAFVSILNASGGALIYSTFLGGSDDATGYGEVASGISVDADGCAVVTGHTSSSNFPVTTEAFNSTRNGQEDAFLCRFSLDGSLDYSTYLGGSGDDWAFGNAVDPYGGVYIFGRTSSADFPVTMGSYDTTYNGLQDVFIAKFGFVVGSVTPIANAGPDQTISQQTLVHFNGSASTDDTGITNYTWTFTYNSTLQTLWSVSPSFAFNIPGTYVVTLTVKDISGLTDTDTTIITVESEINGYWPFDEGSGQNAYDYSGNDNDGVLGSTLGADSTDPDWVTGINGTGIKFAAPNEYVAVPDDATLEVDGPMTFEAWVYKQANQIENGYIYDKEGTSYALLIVGSNYDAPNSQKVRICRPTHVNDVLTSNFTVPNNVWTNIVAVFDGMNYSIYINGVLDTQGIHAVVFPDTIGTLRIGNNHVGDRALNAIVDEAKIWNKALTSSEIGSNYNNTWQNYSSGMPIANAGPDQSVIAGNLVTFVGSASSDDVGIVNWTWSFTDVSIVNLYGENASYTFMTPGSYCINLTVRDGAGNTDQDWMLVNVTSSTLPYELADSPWPMLMRNPKHTSYSNYNTSHITGVPSWTFAVGGDISTSVVISKDSTLYFGTSYPDGHFYALYPYGILKWSFTDGYDVTSTPAVTNDGTVYFGTSKKILYSFTSDGTQKWNITLDASITGLSIGSEGTIYTTTSQSVYAIRYNGSIAWSWGGSFTHLCPPSISDDGTIYVGFVSGLCPGILALEPDGTYKGAYSEPSGMVTATTIGPDGKIYMGLSTKLFAFNPDLSISWSTVGPGTLGAAPAVSPEGVLYVVSPVSDCLTCWNLAGTCIEWGYYGIGVSWASPAISADGFAYLGCSGGVLSVYPNTETLQWIYANGYQMKNAASIGYNGSVFIGGRNKQLLAFGAPTGPSSGPVLNIDTSEYFLTIQSAIDDVDTLNGHTLVISSQTYNETVTISKSLTLIGEDQNTTIINGGGVGTVVTVNAANVNIRNMKVINSAAHPESGIHVVLNKLYAVIENVTVESCGKGIFAEGNYAIIRNCEVYDNIWGVHIAGGDQIVEQNTLRNNAGYNVLVYSGSGATIRDNEINNGGVGLSCQDSSNNYIYHNNFIANTQHATDASTNFYDNGYPSGGNYWSDWTSPDAKSGPLQSIYGSDGFVDNPKQIINGGNLDNYPFAQPSGWTMISASLPFRIDSNSDFATYANGGGNGSQSNPWILHNYIINGTGYGYCIYIGNTTDYFVVKDCLLLSTGSVGTYPFFDQTNLLVYNATNGHIQNNTIDMSKNGGIQLNGGGYFTIEYNNITNADIGILLRGGINDNNTIKNNGIHLDQYGIMLDKSYDNIVMNNNVSENDIHGIYLDSGSRNIINGNNIHNNFLNGVFITAVNGYNIITENNIIQNANGVTSWGSMNYIFHNNFIDNSAQASDSGENSWDDGYPSGGNYWSDWVVPDAFTGVGQNLSGSDGIVDDPRSITGGEFDLYPVTVPNGWLNIITNGTVHNLDTGFSYMTIQSAIDAALTLDGHTILADSAEYHENIVVNKALTIMGEDKNNTFIVRTGTASVVNITCDGAVITGFTIDGTTSEYPGIVLFGVENCTVIGNIIVNCSIAIDIDTTNQSVYSDHVLAKTFTNVPDQEFMGTAVVTGDVNNDGYDDVIISTYRYSDGMNVMRGRVEAFSGKDYSLLYRWLGEGPNSFFGKSLSTGDINNDGYCDVIIGSTTTYGRVQVFSGLNGEIIMTKDGQSPQDTNFGATTDCGDVNNDGYDDVIIGASYFDNYIGRVVVYSGSTQSELYEKIGQSTGDRFGSSVAAGDVDGDGYDDILVGAPYFKVGAYSNGKAYAYSGKNGTLIYSWIGTMNEEYFGAPITSEDINNDGYDDLLITGPGNTGMDGGRIHLINGIDGTFLYNWTEPVDSMTFGSNHEIFDYNNDGYLDFIFSDYKMYVETGRLYIYSGNNYSEILKIYNGERTEDCYSSGISHGDINRDGICDLIVGASGYTDGMNGGKVYVYISSTQNVTNNGNVIIENTIEGNAQGINIDGGNNIVYHNNFINNVVQATSGSVNIFDDGYPSGGNYWSDWTTPDNDTNGFVDYPYEISGGTNKDYYPFAVRNGWLLAQPPLANAGADQYVNQHAVVLFNGNLSMDNFGITNYTWTFTYNAIPRMLWGAQPEFLFHNAGTYVVTLTVQDGGGLTDTDTLIVVILDTTPPVANAGPDQTVEAEFPMSFDGSGSTDNVGVTNYIWRFFYDGNWTELNGVSPSFIFNITGTYLVNLTAQDARGNSQTDDVVITVNNTGAPTADAGLDQNVPQGTLVQFDGSGSTDNVGIVAYSWTFTHNALPQTLTGVAPTFTFSIIGTYTVTLTVTDGDGKTDTDTMTVEVHDGIAPIANAGSDQSVYVGTLVTLQGTGSTDNVGVVNYTWTFTYNAIPRTLWGATPSFYFNIIGTYVITLTVSDAAGLTDTDTMSVLVTGYPGVGIAKVVDKSHTFAGDFLSYTIYYNNTGLSTAPQVWVNDTLPAWVTYLSDTASVIPTVMGQQFLYYFTNVAVGSHSFILTVLISPSAVPGTIITNVVTCEFAPGGSLMTDSATTIIDDITAPVANAGIDRNVEVGTTIIFTGSGSTDNVAIVNYTWTFTYNAIPRTLWGVSPSFKFSILGTYAVTLTVRDAEGLTDADSMTVFVVDTTNPVSNAGYDQTVVAGSVVTLNGTGSMDNVVIVNYTWSFMYNSSVCVLYGPYAFFQFWTTGSYSILLNVTDSSGNWDWDYVIITVIDTESPVADAGADQNVAQHHTVTLDASASSDNDAIANYTWTFTDGVPITLFGPVVNYTFDNAGTFVVTLTIEDASGLTDSDAVVITVGDSTAPVANAGPDQNTIQGGSINFNGSGSYDNVGIVSYSWTFTYNSAGVSLNGMYQSFMFNMAGTYLVTLTVIDGAGNADTDTAIITVGDITAPIAYAGADMTVGQGTIVVFDGSGSTDNLAITNYTWSFDYNTTTVVLYGPNPSFQFDNLGNYTVTLNVTDGVGYFDTDTVVVTVIDEIVPTANAGSDVSISQHQTVTLDASASSDNDAIANYTWTLTDGVPISLFGPVVNYTFDNSGTFIVTLTVTDASGLTDVDSVVVTVADITVPTANAGIDQNVNQGTIVTFDGALSTDNQGIVLYSWTFTYNFGGVVLNGVTPSFLFNNAGTYAVTLTVFDGAGNSDTDTIVVTVADITPPVAVAGNDQNVASGSTANFNGDGSSDNVGIVNFTWSFTHNSTAVLLYGTHATYLFTELGIFNVTLIVIDGAGLTAYDYLFVTVTDMTFPIASIGENMTVDQGTSVDFNASDSSDNVGIVNYTWQVVYGNTTEGFYGYNFTYQFNEPGNYTVILNITDASNNTATTEIIVTVLDIIPPVAVAGPDFTVDEDVQATLDGSASSDNTEIVDYVWTFVDEGIPITRIGEIVLYVFSEPGIYQATLTVTDANGNYATDVVQITVSDTTAPVADAGGDLIVLEGQTAILDGGDSSDNSGIVNYSWTIVYNGTESTFYGESFPFTFDIPGAYTVWLNVTDAEGNQGSTSIIVTVVNVNDAPAFTSTPPLTATEDTPYSYDADATDDDLAFGDSLTFALLSNPSGMSVDPITGLIQWTPGDDHVGSQSVVLAVIDESGAVAVQQFTITVTNINDAPTLSNVPSTIQVVEGELVQIIPVATDPDSAVSFLYNGTIPGLSMPVGGPMWSWTPTFTQAGVYFLTVIATDGTLSDEAVVEITVLEYGNHAPVFVNVPGTQVIDEGQLLTVQTEAIDLDQDPITYALQSPPLGMTISAGGFITWTPAFSQIGNHTIGVVVSDGINETSMSFIVIVTNINNPPVAGLNYYTGIYAYDGSLLNISLRAEGDKYQSLIMTLNVVNASSSTVIETKTITRIPGNPADQMAWMELVLDTGKDYRLDLFYVPFTGGATPTTVTFSWGTSTQEMRNTFNILDGETGSVSYDVNEIISTDKATVRTVEFDASPSWDPDDNIVSYTWDLGDKTIMSGMHVTHEYPKVDVYEVKLTVMDALGASSSITFELDLTPLADEGTVFTYYDQSSFVVYSSRGDMGQVVSSVVADPSGGLSEEQGVGTVVEMELMSWDATSIIDSSEYLKYANITIPYNEDALPEGLDESELRLVWWDEQNSTWVLVENSGVNTVENYVWGNVTHFTKFTAISEDYVAPTRTVPADYSWLMLLLLIIVSLSIGISLTLGIQKPEWLYLATVCQVFSAFASPNEKEDIGTRSLLKGMIMARPGIHYRWIKLQSGKSNGTVAYHLRRLEDSKEIITRRDGLFKRYYPSDMRHVKDVEEMPTLPIQKAILDVLKEHPGASESELSYLIDEPRQKVHYHLKKFEQESVIRIERDDAGNTMCYINDEKDDKGANQSS